MATEIKIVDPEQHNHAQPDRQASQVVGKVSVEVREEAPRKRAPEPEAQPTGDSQPAVAATGTQKHSLDGWTRIEVETPIEEWVRRETVTNTLTNRTRIVIFSMCAYGFIVATTVLMIFLQGFHIGGFNLPPLLLKALVVAVLGEAAVPIAALIRALFK